jgi:hypothetical protein
MVAKSRLTRRQMSISRKDSSSVNKIDKRAIPDAQNPYSDDNDSRSRKVPTLNLSRVVVEDDTHKVKSP